MELSRFVNLIFDRALNWKVWRGKLFGHYSQSLPRFVGVIPNDTFSEAGSQATNRGDSKAGTEHEDSLRLKTPAGDMSGLVELSLAADKLLQMLDEAERIPGRAKDRIEPIKFF